jgi:outer membrane cobalamin receptor
VLGGQVRVYASAAKAFSLPILTAVMYNQQNGGTADLGVERSTNVQAGAGWVSGPWSLGLELSRTRYSDLIYFDLNTFTYAAGQHLRVQGAELRAAFAVDGFGVTGFYRNQEARAEDQPAELQLRDGAVIRRPFQTFGLTGFRDFGAFRGDLAWTWVGPRYENFGGFPAKLGASKVHVNDLALGLTWRHSSAVSLSLKGLHLLQPTLTKDEWKARATDGDNDAYYVFGFPAQPPVLRLEARYRF